MTLSLDLRFVYTAACILAESSGAYRPRQTSRHFRRLELASPSLSGGAERSTWSGDYLINLAVQGLYVGKPWRFRNPIAISAAGI